MKAALTLAALLLMAASPAPQPDAISPDRMAQSVKALSSDAFEGRAPGTPGEKRTIDWLVAQLRSDGLEPGGPGGRWTQEVPLVRTRVGTGTIAVATGAAGQPLIQGRDIYVGTVRPVDAVRIEAAPMVFVGYGVTAPERGWDDFKGVDLHGKVAIFLVNDPDFEAVASDDAFGKFGGRRMTYYGRWTYKYEEAARRGAIAALIVHDTQGAGYGWSTVTAPGGENYDIVRADPDARVLLQGWLTSDAATALFKGAGLDLASLRVKARSTDFQPIELPGARFSADLPVAHEALLSHNVLARICGAQRPDETVMFGAHWDAYGIGAPDAEGRTVRAGANDDALGVAGLLELARHFAAGPRPQRSMVFGFWTAEERGLLGSETYATAPVYPFAKTVANFTLDILQTAGPSRDVLLVGEDQNDLERDLVAAAAKQHRTVTPEALPERGLFYRADHFPMARRGVPTLLLMAISGAPDLVAGGRPAGEAWLTAYMRCYHQSCDRWTPDWNLAGAAADVGLIRDIAGDLANSNRWPAWSKGSEFRAVREKDRPAPAR